MTGTESAASTSTNRTAPVSRRPHRSAQNTTTAQSAKHAVRGKSNINDASDHTAGRTVDSDGVADGAGLWLRARKDWHRRLMFAATVTIIAPALGRITEVTTGFSWTNIILAQLGFMAVAMAFDIVTRSRTHPALLWGAAAIAAMGAIVPPIANLPPVVAFAERLEG